MPKTGHYRLLINKFELSGNAIIKRQKLILSITLSLISVALNYE